MPTRVVSFYLLAPLLMLAVLFSVRFKTDLSAFIVTGQQLEHVLLANEMQSGALSRQYLLSVTTEQQQRPTLSFIRSLQQQLQAIDGVTEVWLPGQQTDKVAQLLTLYGQHAALGYSLQPEQELAKLFTTEGLRQRAELLKNSLLSAQGLGIDKLARQDPLLLSLTGFKTLAAQQRQPISSVYQNIMLETEASGLDIAQQARIQTAIKKTLQHVNKASRGHYLLEMTGVPVFAVATQQLIQGDIQLVSALLIAAQFMLFWWLFRHWQGLLQVFSLLAIALLSAVLITQAVFGYVHAMTLAIGSTLVGICIDYPIHALVHARVDFADKVLAVKRIWPSMVLGGATTLIGYAALGSSGYPGFQQVAVFAGAGIVMSLLLTRFVFPWLLVKRSEQRLSVPFAGAWASFCQRYRTPLAGGFVAVVVLSLLSLNSLHWLTDMQALTPELAQLKQNDQRIRARMTHVEPGRFVLVSAPTIEAALQKSEAVYTVLEELKHDKALSDYYGLYPWLLSAQQQQANQALLKTYLTPEHLAQWRTALAEQGLSVTQLGHFDYAELQPLTLQQVLATPVKNVLANRIIQNDGQALLIIWLAEHEPERVKAALTGLTGVQYFSQRELLQDLTKTYTETARQLLALGLVAITLLLAWRYGHIVKALQTLTPALLAACVMLGFWAVSGVAVSFLHLVGFLLAVSICVDYGIFYQENRSGQIELTYQAIAASMLTSILAFACLWVSESSILRTLGSVVVLGVLLGFLLCPIFIRPSQGLRKEQVPLA